MKLLQRIICLCLALSLILTISYSANAANDLAWERVSNNTSNAVTYGKGIFVCVGAGGTILTSVNGTAWKKVRSGISTSLNGVFWNGEKFIVLGEQGVILVSKDAISWRKCNSGTRVSLKKAAGKKKQYVIVGDKGVILYSKDGEKWSKAVSSTNNCLRGVSADASLFIAVGDNSTIMSSADGVRWKAINKFVYSNWPASMLQDINWNGITFNIVGYTKTAVYPVYLQSSTAAGPWMNETLYSVGTQDMSGIKLRAIAWDGTQNIAVGSNGSVIALPECHKCRSYKSISGKTLWGVTPAKDRIVSVGNCGIHISEINTNIQSVSPEIAIGRIASGAFLIDVRSPEEYSEKHIPKSVNIPLDVLGDKILGLVPEKGQEIIVYCASGIRSRKAAELLAKLHYTNIYNLGGINKWPYETEAGSK